MITITPPRMTLEMLNITILWAHGIQCQRYDHSSIADNANYYNKPNRGLLLLFMSMGWNYVSELWPPTGLLFIPQMIYEYGEPQWNDTDGENRRSRIKNCPSTTLSTTNTVPHGLTWVWTWASAVRGRWLTTWTMVQHKSGV
jgi:hypothetical protein